MSSAASEALAGELRAYLVFDWTCLVIMILFLTVTLFTCWGAWKRFQVLRARSIVPLVREGLAVSRTGQSTAKCLITHGKHIYETSARTSDSMGDRARTAALMFRGAAPEVQHLASDVSATSQSVRRAVRTLETGAGAVRAVRAVMVLARRLSTRSNPTAP